MATMTVKDLIEKLSHVDEDAMVCVPDKERFITHATQIMMIDAPYYLKGKDDKSNQACVISWTPPKIVG